jgi:hypothetical protein
LEAKLRSIKAVYENGVIEDITQGIIIVKDSDGLRYDAVNILPVEQLALSAIVVSELIGEYFLTEEPDPTMEMFLTMLRALISSLLNTKQQTKGEVIQ